MLDSSLAVPQKVSVQATVAPKVETGGWKSVKVEKAIAKDRPSNKVQKRNRVSSLEHVILGIPLSGSPFPISLT